MTFWPAWMRELRASLVTNPQVVLWGNVKDRVLIDGGEGQRLNSFFDALWAVYEADGFDALAVWDPVDGLSFHAQRTESVDFDDAVTGGSATHQGLLETIQNLARRELDLTFENEDKRAAVIALVIDYAPRLVEDPNRPRDHELRFFTGCLKECDQALPGRVGADGAAVYNQVVWLCRDERDLPLWFTTRNPGLRMIPIPEPDLGERKAAAEVVANSVFPEAEPRFAELFAEHAQGLTLDEMLKVVQLSRSNDVEADDIDEAVRMYRFGFSDNPWRSPDRLQRIQHGEQTLNDRVIGQRRAVKIALDTLMRSATDMTGVQGNRSRPRGILVFAGPTGVGKTELAKALTQLVFGSEDAHTRFDMSEYSSEHNEARLIGSPPGYVGHDAGGQLTSAVRQKPFSLLLFDEIDKAHPLILDKFLQILEDGRLTDGAGATVSFSETIIVFTTNLGIRNPGDGTALVSLEERQDRGFGWVAETVTEAIRSHFNSIQRPEIYNRLGQNIVVFDFIDHKTARPIFDQKVGNIIERVQTEHGVKVEIASSAMEELFAYCTEDLDMGGRSIVNRLEFAFINPLTRPLFARIAAGDSTEVTWRVSGLTEGEEGFELVIE